MKKIIAVVLALSIFPACSSSPPKPKYMEEKNQAKFAKTRDLSAAPDQAIRAARAVLDQLTRDSNPQASEPVKADGNTIYTGWVYSRASRDKYVRYDYNGAPQRKDLAVRRIYGYTVEKALSGSKVALNIEEEIQMVDLKTGDPTKWKRVDTEEAAYDMLMRKYRVWYADPPWEYGNAGVIGETDNYGHAARHYPTMSIDELCEMGARVKEVCEPDAVLFMWVTSPLLEECFPVIKAWGFQYKTSFVWDKIGHNYGHYNSVRHELLLVCTRGSCTPDDKTLYDSVISIEKSRTHSEKPAEFRRMIDSLYTWGNRIELFARCAADGWDAWGNEA
jgi:site-specific DNA-methyltransferase (adenine-specific)